tara:strand:+ start:1173 stop:1394 length:222 start_codon:yes stop_codon:yes gene_type:complete
MATKEEVQTRIDRLKELTKELLDQQRNLSADIKVREADLVIIRNSYEKVNGAIEIVALQSKELKEELNVLEDG